AYRLFRTADNRLISLSISFESRFWASLCDLVELPELSNLSSSERLERSSELVSMLAAKIRLRTRIDWEGLFESVDLPFGPVLDLDELARDLRATGSRLLVDADADASTSAFLRQPMAFADERAGR